MADELVPREELRATLSAREELGGEFEPELVERFAEQLERRLEQRLAKLATVRSGQRMGLAIVSLGISIPLLAIAGGTAGIAGILAVCAALVLVNFFAGR